MRKALLQGCTLAAGTLAFAAGIACAQQGEMKGGPSGGLLEGQAPPQGPLRKGGPPRPPVPGPLVELRTRNATHSKLWVALYRDGNFDRGGCVAPGEEHSFALPGDADRVPWKVVGKMTRDARCQQPVDCEASIDRRPGMVSLEMNSRGNACGWRPVRTEAPAPATPSPGQPSRRRPHILGPVENRSGAYIWVSLFTPPRRGTMELLDTMCLAPGHTSAFGVYDGVAYIVEGSVRMAEGCLMAAGCESKLSYVGSQQPVRFEGNERSCRWVP